MNDFRINTLTGRTVLVPKDEPNTISLTQFFKKLMEENHETTDTNAAGDGSIETGNELALPGMEEHVKPITVTQQDVNDAITMIESETVESCGKKITVTTARLANGFTITESATCVDQSNYSIDVGETINLRKIEDKVWFLLGYELQSKMACNCAKPCETDVLLSCRKLIESALGQDSLSDDEISDALDEIDAVLGTGDYKSRVRLEHDALERRLIDLNVFIASKKFLSLELPEQHRMASQAKSMQTYLTILKSRIANFTDEG